ncbi:DNA-binding transcriptional regulator, MerR family [Saccharopolyspora kobensis]|uniref:DNA-binding transcriptional regulator, MerR family n=1 Tax=Saccharopolyspora kobensis TaxID=146035 RepID=A0A1H5Y325_9PSEU|nr:MerR family transcriptional regulator [Saccharopolyspora kobensis]SEG18242.1 DNA-binding transcriptional regulator, MerR family [Saccharopolyspora kobensis]SFF09185.1 DNA-binding transcriptional regulator, MerR family [Saccharopolyspora kobensis]
MRIGELAERTGVSVRLLRYYEEQDLIRPERDELGHRVYGDGSVDRVGKIRGLLDSGIPTRIIRDILPCLDRPGAIHMRVVAPEMLANLERERAKIQQRVEALSENLSAIDDYLSKARPNLRRS